MTDQTGLQEPVHRDHARQRAVGQGLQRRRRGLRAPDQAGDVDHGYKADTAKMQFPQIEPKVLGFVQLLGSPVMAALQEHRPDKVTTTPASWSSELLDNPYVMIVGTTYDLEIINGLSYLLEQGRSRTATRSGTSTSTASTAGTACAARSTSPSSTR